MRFYGVLIVPYNLMSLWPHDSVMFFLTLQKYLGLATQKMNIK